MAAGLVCDLQVCICMQLMHGSRAWAPATGCGMCAVPLKGLHKDDVSLEQLQALQTLIKKRIPVGAPGCRPCPERFRCSWGGHAVRAHAKLSGRC